MRLTNPKALFRRFSVLILAALVTSQLSVSLAQAADPCHSGDCDDAIHCMISSCTGCAPLPAGGIDVVMASLYLTQILPADWFKQIPDGAPSDIWRPPPVES